ncbi:MAG: polyphosphate polymerase domain-containing protein [Bacteroidales bacterium]|nr:polyphosphate polymerase domain-containing protein [Bacteroidales bacterium]
MLPAILTTLDTMQPIGLDEMKSVRLMNRMDQKYMASIDQLVPLLENIADGYYIQHIAPSTPDHNNSATQLSKFVQPYHTLYFDTDGLEMYTMHHNQKLNRQKLRVRTYRSTNTTFFEIKNKDNKKKTRKIRIPIDVSQFDHALKVTEVADFVERNTPYSTRLHECLENSFERITLVDKGMSERVTIDSGITFHNRATQIDADISRLLVIEVKHEVGAPASRIECALHEMHILPRRMSKYCIGTALTDPSAKYNRFKPKILFIQNKCMNA